jgi:uncharacterized protein YcfL
MMMKKSVILICVLIIGCGGSLEDAQSNFQKGNEFFDHQEYDVAEYYYEKVPQDSPLYQEAAKKIDEIENIRRELADNEVSKADLSNISILDQSNHMDIVSNKPFHRILFVNHTAKTLKSVTFEFVYLDKDGNEVDKLTKEVKIRVNPNETKEIKGIEPGTVTKIFNTAQVAIIGGTYE